MVRSYTQMKATLLELFANNAYQTLEEHQRHDCVCQLADCCLNVCYPGKHYRERWYHPLDYRVDLAYEGNAYGAKTPLSLSHAEVIRDLYLKVVRDKNRAEPLCDLLVALYGDCCLRETDYLPDYRVVSGGNGRVRDLSIPTLMHTIRWIAMQEEFNYPSARYEGRVMPFKRYLEAIDAGLGGHHPVEEVLDRADCKGQAIPSDWPGFNYRGMSRQSVNRVFPSPEEVRGIMPQDCYEKFLAWLYPNSSRTWPRHFR